MIESNDFNLNEDGLELHNSDVETLRNMKQFKKDRNDKSPNRTDVFGNIGKSGASYNRVKALGNQVFNNNYRIKRHDDAAIMIEPILKFFVNSLDDNGKKIEIEGIEPNGIANPDYVDNTNKVLGNNTIPEAYYPQYTTSYSQNVSTQYPNNKQVNNITPSGQTQQHNNTVKQPNTISAASSPPSGQTQQHNNKKYFETPSQSVSYETEDDKIISININIKQPSSIGNMSKTYNNFENQKNKFHFKQVKANNLNNIIIQF